MQIQFNFNSKICTTREQSERLLLLGLKSETADMKYPCTREYYGGVLTEGTSSLPILIDTEDDDTTEYDIPAWSLCRLIEMMPPSIRNTYHYGLIYDIHRDWVCYMSYAQGRKCPYNKIFFESQSTKCYDAFIDCIEWLIKEGYFNKEYLEK